MRRESQMCAAAYILFVVVDSVIIICLLIILVFGGCVCVGVDRREPGLPLSTRDGAGLLCSALHTVQAAQQCSAGDALRQTLFIHNRTSFAQKTITMSEVSCPNE